MEYKKGERVRHPIKDEWGLGEVLEDSNGVKVRIFFVGVGEKTLSLKLVEPLKVVGSDADHPVLDNLKVSNKSSGIEYRSLPQSIDLFLELFPQGFYGDKFKEHEREYKDSAHALAKELLGRQPLGSLVKSESYEEIGRRALRVANATNLIFPNEKMALKDGLDKPEWLKLFGDTLFSVLYGEGGMQQRFTAFAHALEEIGAAKWTVATYFLFILLPDKHMFVKPTVTQYAAEISGFEINYRPQVNWATYDSVLKFSEYLFRWLSELKPRDMIDVQSFMWSIAPGSYRGA